MDGLIVLDTIKNRKEKSERRNPRSYKLFHAEIVR